MRHFGGGGMDILKNKKTQSPQNSNAVFSKTLAESLIIFFFGGCCDTHTSDSPSGEWMINVFAFTDFCHGSVSLLALEIHVTYLEMPGLCCA